MLASDAYELHRVLSLCLLGTRLLAENQPFSHPARFWVGPEPCTPVPSSLKHPKT